jgi:hypothetical protein|uniref:Uncharacterized protein n=1 Tax=Thermocrispum agreste TaxID=37925 RepID=A0A2W4JAN5_9PSEU|nr:MAG: hypothetical protein DIU77_10955 [Thermocrispum agreste]
MATTLLAGRADRPDVPVQPCGTALMRLTATLGGGTQGLLRQKVGSAQDLRPGTFRPAYRSGW